MKRFRALIFDVDGTLAETEEVHRRAFNEAFSYFELPWFWDSGLYRKLLRVSGGKERIRHFIDHHSTCGTLLSVEQIAELHRFKNARYFELVRNGGCRFRPGVADVLADAVARRQLLAIATTTSRENVAALLATLEPRWSGLFQAVLCGEDVERKKPSPEVYRKILDLLGLPAHQCLAVEDSRNGLLAAQGAGIPVLITRSFYFADDDFAGALAVVANLAALKNQSLPDLNVFEG